jgi:hypothetical protein
MLANFPLNILKPLFIGFYTVGYFPAINVLVPKGICHDDAAAILIITTVVLKIVHATEDDSVDDGHYGYIRYTVIYCIIYIYTRPLNVTLWMFFSCLTTWRRVT